MKHAIFFLIFLPFGYAKANFTDIHIQQIYKAQSELYEKWEKQWGNYEWSDNAIGNKSYAFETAYIIIEMIDKDDIDGLKCLYQVLQKDKKHNMAFLNEIIGEPTFEKEAIEKENVKALEFFLHNGVVENDATIIDIDAGQEYSLLELATQKLQEAKAKGDSKAIQNYEKIIKLLEYRMY